MHQVVDVNQPVVSLQLVEQLVNQDRAVRQVLGLKLVNQNLLEVLRPDHAVLAALHRDPFGLQTVKERVLAVKCSIYLVQSSGEVILTAEGGFG